MIAGKLLTYVLIARVLIELTSAFELEFKFDDVAAMNKYFDNTNASFADQNDLLLQVQFINNPIIDKSVRLSRLSSQISLEKLYLTFSMVKGFVISPNSTPMAR